MKRNSALSRPVRRTRLLALLGAASLLGLVACGDDASSGTPATVPPVGTSPTSSPESRPSGIQHPIGADEVVLRIGYEGGFVPVEYTFLQLPALLVTGDGRLIVQGAIPAIYPGPLLPALQVRSISEAGIQQLLALAAEHGLLAAHDYPAPGNVADAADTVVTISVDGETIEHRAYALGFGEESDELRASLAAFVTAVTGEWTYGANPELGPEVPYSSDTYLVRATPVADLGVFEIEPTVLAWPADQAPLVSAAECAAYPAVALVDTFSRANQLTFFDDDGVTYQLTVKPRLPGDGC